jgi:hypothetical protein
VRARKFRHVYSLHHVERLLQALDLGSVELELRSDDWEGWRGPPVRVWWYSDG